MSVRSAKHFTAANWLGEEEEEEEEERAFS